MSQFYDAALAPVGIKSTQYAILFELVRTADSGTAVTMHELADRLVMDRSTLGHNLRPLERDALVRLRPARDDLRKRHVELTAKGREVMRQSQLLWKEAENRFEVIFGKQPAADLRAVLHGIANNGELISRPIG